MAGRARFVFRQYLQKAAGAPKWRPEGAMRTMANFVMMTGPFAGHVAPALPIARKLVQRGHDVVWITGRQYRGRVEATGARFHALPGESDPDGRQIYEFYPELKKLKGVPQIKYWIKYIFLDASHREVATIESVLEGFPADALIGDTITFGLYFAAELMGLPSACISVLPGSMPSRDTAPYGLGLLPGNHVLSRMRNRLLNVLILRLLFRDVNAYTNRVREALGLEALDGPLLSAMPRRISLIMHTSTKAFEYPRSDLPDNIKSIGPIMPEAHLEFQPPDWWPKLSGSEPVVLVNQGTVATDPADLIAPAIEGLKDQGMQVVAVPVKGNELGTLPTNVHVDEFIPFGHLFPHVDVMVTNGGYGGTQFALAHGIPLVVAGETEDKREVAARVEWSGAGINLRTNRPRPEAIRRAVREVLQNPVYRENAKRVQADFAEHDGPTRAAELLEALAVGKAIE